ncbi:uncharacterized protein KRP23_259 [Phytophthora ramorum]|uniref:uncharacterized protein n=1 Tax=Phytophthora ramorum TaxID=164328 RepID=UPI0030AA8C87|nr:hypothetical protein KRP23_259 [Phytophthora ramorum]
MQTPHLCLDFFSSCQRCSQSGTSPKRLHKILPTIKKNLRDFGHLCLQSLFVHKLLRRGNHGRVNLYHNPPSLKWSIREMSSSNACL